MAKQSKTFTFTAPIVDSYRQNKVVGSATVSGIGYWNYQNDEWDKDYADFDLMSVKINDQESLQAYHVSKALSDSLADEIDNIVYAHMQYLFFPVYTVVAIAGTAEQLTAA